MLTFLKLGGSLITDKTKPYTPCLDLLDSMAEQIAAALKEIPSMRLVLGHGSGSYGHTPAANYRTRQGVRSLDDWRGFSEVWYQATSLNRLVVDALHKAGLPIITISPAASVTAHAGAAFIWDIYPLQSALKNGLIPVIHGDVIFDDEQGGTILSTEELFSYLAPLLLPERMLIAGLEEGVWKDFPNRSQLIGEITPANLPEFSPAIGSSKGTDVTGGMLSKVNNFLKLIEKMPSLQVYLFSGCGSDSVKEALLGNYRGTHLHR